MFRMVNRRLPFSIQLITIVPMLAIVIDELSTKLTAAPEQQELLQPDPPDLQGQ